MATLTAEQIEQKKQLLEEKVKQMKAIYNELVEAGAIELPEDELDQIAGGGKISEAMDKGAEWLYDNIFEPYGNFWAKILGL
jgi:hypothetical protein